MKTNCLAEYIKEIIAIKKTPRSENTGFFYSRGESEDYGETACIPSIFRKKEWIKNEDKIFRDAITINPDEFVNDKLTIDKLTRMQHYGLPTRLLDVSENALVSLYMALDSESSRDPVVWIFSVPEKNVRYFDSDRVSVIANLAKREKFSFPRGFDKKAENIRDQHEKERYLKKFNSDKHIKYLLHEIKDEKPYFKDEIWPEHLYSVICVKPRQNNKRIIRQQGMFLLFGNSSNNQYKPAELRDSGIEKKMIRIDGKSKKQIIEELELTGINKATVYPDLQNVSEYIKNKYSGAKND